MRSSKFLFLLILFTGVIFAQNRININGKELFLNGINIAWDRYANDVGDTPIDENKFRQIVVDVRSAGGNALRWWLSTNGANDPKFDGTTGLVSGLGSETISNVRKVLDLCEANGLVVSLCLLSHNYLQDQHGMNIDNNIQMLTTDAGLQAYIDNALVPLVTAIGNHPAIACWEIFNEPEGMVDGNGWAVHSDGSGFTMERLQIFVNRCAGAIKRVNDSLLVSNGTHTFEYNSDVGTFKNYYSDAELIAAGGDSLGTLDFYQIHFYPHHQGDDTSPFHNHASHWGLDKPVVVGEFPNLGCVPIEGNFKPSSQLSPVEALNYLYDNGYAGGLSWPYTGHDGLGDFKDISPALLDLYENHTEDIFIADLTEDTTTGNYAMKLNIDGLSESMDKEWVTTLYSEDLSANSKISLDIKIDSVYSGESIKIRFVTQSGSWAWCQASNIVTVPNNGNWFNYEINLLDMSGIKTDQMQSIIVQILPSGTEAFSGVVLIDNIQSDATIISDFNDKYSLWGAGAKSVAITNISAVKVDAVEVVANGKSELDKLAYAQRASTIFLTGLQKRVSLQLFSANGKELKIEPHWLNGSSASFKTPVKGIYFLRIKNSGKCLSKKIVVQ